MTETEPETTQPRRPPPTAPSRSGVPTGLLGRLGGGLLALLERLSGGDDDQDDRIAALEREVARLRDRIEHGR